MIDRHTLPLSEFRGPTPEWMPSRRMSKPMRFAITFLAPLAAVGVFVIFMVIGAAFR